MILPQPFFFIIGATFLAHLIYPETFTSICSNNLSSSKFSKVLSSGRAAAQFTKISILPNSFSTSKTVFLTCSLSFVSQIKYSTLTDETLEISFLVSINNSSFLAKRAIFTPSLDNVIAVAFPIPLLDPVMRATFPEISKSILFTYACFFIKTS